MIVLFILFSSPLYLQTKPAFADTLPCKCVDRATGKTEIIPSFPVSSEDNPTRNEKDQCNNQCKSNGYTFGSFTFNHLPAYNESLTDILWDTVKTIDPLENIKDSFGKALVSVVNGLLIVILQLVGWLFDVAMVLFAWIADANNLNRVISNEGVYFGWKTVRDLLNISFILILLFTAFAIVFQIDKYNKKTTVLTLVIMALLINFSFPITRAIIDASNILMYTIIKNISGGTSALGTLTGATGIQNIINSAEGATTTSLIASIIFVFILMITMLAISLMLVTRIVALALLIIFSPIAFIPLPGNNYGADWWKNLFKYCFFGPIMMFMILIATQIMNYMGKHSLDMKKIASSHTIDNAIVGDMAYFAIPIVILWIGMGMAQKMGVEGAGVVMGRAQKMSKWAGKTFSGAGFAQKTYKAYQSRRQEAQKSSLANKFGAWAGSKQDWVRSGVPLPGKRDAAIRYQRDQAARIKQEAERNDTANMDTIDLRALGTNGNKFEQAAAKLELANRQQSAGANSQADLDSVRNTFGETSQIFRQLNAKVRAFDPVAAFSHIDPTTRNTRYDDFIKSSGFDLKKINSNSLGDSAFVGRMFENNAISAKDVAELGKDPDKKSALDTSLATLTRTHTDATSDMDQKINMARFANSGTIDNAAFAGHIFKNMDKDTARHMDSTAIAGRLDILAQNVKGNVYKEIISNMKDEDIAREINEFILNPTTSALGTNAAAVNNVANRDLFLQSFHS